jgi:hypothetical protein
LADSGSTDFALSDFLSLPDCRCCSFAAASTIDPIAVALRIAVAVDVPLGGLDRPGRGGKDEEASCLLIGEYFCLFSRHN